MKQAWPLALLALLVVAAFFFRSGGAPPPEPPRTSRPPELPPDSPAPPAPVKGGVSDPLRTPSSPGAPPPDPAWVQDAVVGPLLWFLKIQNEDGSFGDGGLARLGGHNVNRIATTSLALLGFLGAGISAGSYDTPAYRGMGEAVGKGLAYLLKNRRPNGTFEGAFDLLDHALGTLALVQAARFFEPATPDAPNPYLDSARMSLQALTDMQGRGGRFGSEYQTGWAALVFVTASDEPRLPFPKAVFERLKAYYDQRRQVQDPMELVVRTRIDGERKDPWLSQAASWLATSPPDPGRLDLIFMQSMALFRQEGFSETYKQWTHRAKGVALSTSDQEGRRKGATQAEAVINTAMATLALEIHDRWMNALGLR